MLSSCRRLLLHVLVPSFPLLSRGLRLFPLHFMKPLVVFVLGGPGAGKGTQCARIVEVRPCGRATEDSRAKRGRGQRQQPRWRPRPPLWGADYESRRPPRARAEGRRACECAPRCPLCFCAPLLPLPGSGSSPLAITPGCESPANPPRGTRPGSCGS